jgi:hypothetical protein
MQSVTPPSIEIMEMEKSLAKLAPFADVLVSMAKGQLDEREALRSVLAALVRDADSEPDGEYLQGAGKNRVAVHRKGIERARAALAATPADQSSEYLPPPVQLLPAFQKHAENAQALIGKIVEKQAASQTHAEAAAAVAINSALHRLRAGDHAGAIAPLEHAQLALAAAAAPVVLPEPVGEAIDVFNDGKDIGVDWQGKPPTHGAKLFTEQQVRALLAGVSAPAAPQAPAAPVGFPWRTGAPPWTDDRAVRVIAVTAHDDFGGVQVHDIRASDFHADGDRDCDGDGAEVARACTHWAYRDDIWPRTAQEPAADALAVEQSERASWFALAMNAAANIEDASACLHDEDAKRAAVGAAKHVREKCNAMWNAAPQAQAGARDALAASLSQAARDVLAERKRQVSAEGWSPADDDGYIPGVLSAAAGCYASQAYGGKQLPEFWPWTAAWWKPSEDPRRNLEKAGALILAEMERIDRAAIVCAAAAIAAAQQTQGAQE